MERESYAIMPRHVRRKRDRVQTAWEQRLREKALKELRRTIRREWRERLAALVTGDTPPNEADGPAEAECRRQPV
jgi:hypothetical protein